MRISFLTTLSAAALIAGAATAQDRPVGVQVGTFVPDAPVAAEASVDVSADASVASDAGMDAGVDASATATATVSGYSDAELESFDSAMGRMRAVTEALQGAQPTAEQQAEMAAAVQDSGLTIDRFNSIATAVSGDAVLRARLAVVSAPPSAAGSVAAGVTDDEVRQFSAAMARMRSVTEALQGAQPTAEQQAEMAAAVQDSGLTIDRFNAVATAVSQDAALRARVELADAQRAG